jgi:hypothetical protein
MAVSPKNLGGYIHGLVNGSGNVYAYRHEIAEPKRGPMDQPVHFEPS